MKLISEGSSIFNNEFFEALKKLSLPKVTAGALSEGGNRKSSVKGRGSEFSDFREYVLGDDIRMLDWNAFGRLGKLYIKRFLEEREITCHVAIDVSPSAKFDKEKFVRMLQIAGFIIYIALSGGDRVRVIFYDGPSARLVDERLGVSGFYNCLRIIEKNINTEDLMLKDSFTGLIRTSGITALISDFYPEQALDYKYLHFYKKQELIFIQTFGGEEIDPEFDGNVNLKDYENRGNVKVLLSTKVAKEYRKRLRLFTEDLMETARRYGGHYMMVDCRKPLKTIVSKGTGTVWL